MDDVLHPFIRRAGEIYGCIFCHIILFLVQIVYYRKPIVYQFDKQSVVKVSGETFDHETSYILLNIIHNE